jgi:hypothetical protein
MDAPGGKQRTARREVQSRELAELLKVDPVHGLGLS